MQLYFALVAPSWEDYTMKRVVITGATGALGRALIKICIEAGYEVLAVVHRLSKRAGDLHKIKNCSVLYLDLSEYDNALDEMQKQGLGFVAQVNQSDKAKMSHVADEDVFEFFFHLAWMAPFGKERENLELQLENVKASLAAVRFAKALDCKVFIGAGSQAEYGRVNEKLTPDTPTHPETGYGIAKLCAGQMTRLACYQINNTVCGENESNGVNEQNGIILKHIWTRVLSVYGPYDRDQTLISVAIDDMINNRETSFSLCDQMWDYIFSDDAARAMLLAAQKGKHGGVYVIGRGEAQPLKEYIKKIAEITDYKKKIGFGKRPYSDKQVMCLQADISELEKLGFEPQISFEEGINAVIELYN